MMGKNTRLAATTIFETGLRIPNQLFANGAKAMMGMALMATATGRIASRDAGQRETPNATASPATKPIARPPSASIMVTCAAGRI